MNFKKINNAVFKLEFGAPSNPIDITMPFLFEEETDFKVEIDSEGKMIFLTKEEKLATVEKYYEENGKACLICNSKQAHFFGFGEKMGEIDKRGRKMVMMTRDNPLHLPDTDPLYVSIPFFIVLSPNKPAMGFYVNSTSKTSFDMQGDTYTIEVEDEGIELYAIYGPKVSDVLKHFSSLVGKMQLPPAWALGYQQSRWSYFPSDEVISVARRMRKDGIPCDVIYLDIDYMDGYKVFTWSKEGFPNPKETVNELKKMGFKVVPIIDPGVKVEDGYEVYESGKKKDAFVKSKDGSPFVGYVWPGRCNFPDFLRKDVRKWWAAQHKKLFDMGVDGIWNDMNEPAVVWDDEKNNELKSIAQREDFDFSVLGRLKSFENQKEYSHDIVHKGDDGKEWEHLKVRNAYALLEAQATTQAFETFRKGKRPFILSRSGFAGIQKYAAIWTGDNTSWWEHLKGEMAISMGLGLSGVPFCGTDVGGFGGNATAELLIRWTEMGVFFPFFRNHSAIGTRHQEPWAFDQKTEEIIKMHIKKRYELFPHLYTLFYHSSITGLPIMRPLFMHDQDDETLYSVNDEFMVGDSIMVAPITHSNAFWRPVYFPAGKWIDTRDGHIYEGKRIYKVDAPLEEIPVFAKENSIIPRTDPFNYIFEKPQMNLYLDVYGQEAQMVVYEDDGESLDYKNGKYNLYEVSVGNSAETLYVNVKYLNHGYEGRYKKFVFRFLSIEKASNVIVNGKNADIRFENGVPQVLIKVADLK
ncbi:TIM-barrel domain-containing protein [Mesoaciditoga lauensis]|uniref:glycoside hydrolase family 31 protein n=1 Tax=Mesoaciditoga lauensis TaxID=1495039 RepID=UPI00068C751A|nr:TIM-barrel domain-containing protein [Mesoaciditoga lauensis]